MWLPQALAVQNLERLLAEVHPRALIQMATGSGKTFIAIRSTYRLIKHADGRRMLYLVDRADLGWQALKEFQQYVTPDDGRKFIDIYNVQLRTSNCISPVAPVVLTTIQRLYSTLQSDGALDAALDEGPLFQWWGDHKSCTCQGGIQPGSADRNVRGDSQVREGAGWGGG